MSYRFLNKFNLIHTQKLIQIHKETQNTKYFEYWKTKKYKHDKIRQIFYKEKSISQRHSKHFDVTLIDYIFLIHFITQNRKVSNKRR